MAGGYAVWGRKGKREKGREGEEGEGRKGEVVSIKAMHFLVVSDEI